MRFTKTLKAERRSETTRKEWLNDKTYRFRPVDVDSFLFRLRLSVVPTFVLLANFG